ncbi:MAG: hypothetical protein ACRDPQ_10450 [Nocardioidaceae bacterium]
MKELLNEEVQNLPSEPVPVNAVIRDGRRRLWRYRAVGGTAAFAALAAVAVVAPLVGGPGNGDDAGPAITHVDRTVATYSRGSTIHYGDREIDVSPHQVLSFVRTDDGFVFVNQDSEVYFADGATVEKVGDGNGWWKLAADDTGSYVGWVEDDGGERSEFVVYDTSTRTDVLRTSEGTVSGIPGYDGPKAARLWDIDGDIAYVHDAEGATAWNLTDGTSERIASGVGTGWLFGVADGQIAHLQGDGSHRYVVVSDDPAADQSRVRLGWDPLGAELSPTGKHVVTIAWGTAQIAVTEMPSQRDVTPDDSGYADAGGLAPLQWVGDDVFYAVGTPRGGESADVVRCTISTSECRVVVESVGPSHAIQGPSGENSPIE